MNSVSAIVRGAWKPPEAGSLRLPTDGGLGVVFEGSDSGRSWRIVVVPVDPPSPSSWVKRYEEGSATEAPIRIRTVTVRVREIGSSSLLFCDIVAGREHAEEFIASMDAGRF